MINNFKDKYHFLSNFYTASVVIDGLKYQNNEAAFQAMKCKDKKEREVFTTLNPSESKRLGRKVDLREDWGSKQL